MVVEISLTKIWKERKRKRRTNRRMPICNLTIQLVVANLYTIFEVSNLNGCGDIFDEKSGEKEKKNVEKNKKEKDHLQSHDTTCRCEPVYQI